MFERFTEGSRRVIVQASEEARRRRHDYIGTEHLLLGLVHDEQGAGTRVLGVLGISPDAVRRELDQCAPAGAGEPQGHLPFSPDVKRALELALQETLLLNSEHIGTEHLVLGLIREGQGAAAQALTALGAELDQARRAVREIAPEPKRPE